MHPKNFPYLALLSFIITLIIFAGFVLSPSRRYNKEVPLTTEHELKVTLEAGFGDVAVSRGKSSLILNADIDTDKGEGLSDFIDYSLRDRVGYLLVNTNAEVRTRSKKHSINFEGFHSNTVDIRLTDAVPISFDVGLGLGKGDFDFTGLQVKDLKLSAGASSVFLKFDRPNRSVIEDLTIESGLSKFEGQGLCNANFNHMKFEGGVGSYVLDFGGKLEKEIDVDIEVGLGSLTLRIPEEIGARIFYEKSWIAHLDLDRDFSERQENTYISSNYRTATGKMNIRIDAGLGSVKIKRE